MTGGRRRGAWGAAGERKNEADWRAGVGGAAARAASASASSAKRWACMRVRESRARLQSRSAAWLAAEDFVEDVALGGVLDDGGAEGVLGAFGHGGDAGIEVGGLDAIAALLHPDGADQGLDEVLLDGADGLELLEVLGGEALRARRDLRRG